MHRLHRNTILRASTATTTPLPRALVSERLHGTGHDGWMGWTVADDVVVIAVAGEICTAGAPELLARIEELVLEFPARTVMLDLSRVGFADARAVTLLVRLDRACCESGSELSVTATSPAVDRVLRLCGWPAAPHLADTSAEGARHGDGELLAVRRGVDPIRN